MDLPPIARLIGNTPLVEIARSNPHAPRVRVFGKCEFANPGGSVKDRAALWMLKDGLASGELSSNKTIVDATSGNTGISLAMLGAALGNRVELYMPATASDERKKILAAYGARVVETPPEEGQDGAIVRVRDAVKADPSRYFYVDQYSNPANPRAHYESTGPEIWRDTQGSVTHVVAGLGTSGTVMGTGRYLRERNLAIRILGVEPDAGFHGIEGLKHMASSIVPSIFDAAKVDVRAAVRTERAYEMARELARREGLFVGPSSGATVAAALDAAAKLASGERATIVAILADGGSRYLSTRAFSETAAR